MTAYDQDTKIASFRMGRQEVTQGEYEAVMGMNPSGNPAGEIWPAENLNWYAALAYCNRLSIREGLEPVYRIGGSTDPDDWGTIPSASSAAWNAVTRDMPASGYRLPTEAEWEWAARGGSDASTYTWAGSSTSTEVAWHAGNSGNATHPVGTLAANGLGLFDLSGNVSEFCWDGYSSGLAYPSSARDPTGGANASYRMIRGGSARSPDASCTVAYRGLYAGPWIASNTCGFRVVRLVSADAETVLLSATEIRDYTVNTLPVLSASVTPYSASNGTLVWESDNHSVVTVADGVLSVQGAGQATVTVKANTGDGDATNDISASCTVELRSIAPEMVTVPGGSMTVGTSTVELSSFRMASFEVTQGQYEHYMGTNPSLYSAGKPFCPVDSVSWYAAVAYCNRLSIAEGLEPVYSIGGSTDPSVWGTIPTSSSAVWNAVIMDRTADGWRLPTEAEWEWAAREGSNTGTWLYSGSNTASAVGWFAENSLSSSHQVGLLSPNQLGIYDLSGNVPEYCWDLEGWTFPFSALDPVGKASSSYFYHCIRGGSFLDAAASNGLASRAYKYCFPYSNGSSSATYPVGIRPVRLVPAKATSIVPEATSLTVYKGSTVSLPAVTAIPYSAVNAGCLWTSGDTGAVSVNGDGTFTAVSTGTAVLTVTASNGTAETADDVSATCTVLVVDPAIDMVTVPGGTFTTNSTSVTVSSFQHQPPRGHPGPVRRGDGSRRQQQLEQDKRPVPGGRNQLVRRHSVLQQALRRAGTRAGLQPRHRRNGHDRYGTLGYGPCRHLERRLGCRRHGPHRERIPTPDRSGVGMGRGRGNRHDERLLGKQHDSRRRLVYGKLGPDYAHRRNEGAERARTL